MKGGELGYPHLRGDIFEIYAPAVYIRMLCASLLNNGDQTKNSETQNNGTNLHLEIHGQR